MNKKSVLKFLALALSLSCIFLSAPNRTYAEEIRGSCGGKASMTATGDYSLSEQREIVKNSRVLSSESSEDVYKDDLATVRVSTASFRLERDDLGSHSSGRYRIEEYTVACTFSCSGQSCSQSGCRATLQGCTEFSCTGTGCTGSCSGSSGVTASD